ncbi:MAG: hypothetical protein GXP15_03370 [Gammaproteobacteria bacterium]|nr:hypothetical protein [Gammaproteobacteria bacterium]
MDVPASRKGARPGMHDTLSRVIAEAQLDDVALCITTPDEPGVATGLVRYVLLIIILGTNAIQSN